VKTLLLTLNAIEYVEHVKRIIVAVPDDCEDADLNNFGLPCLDSLTEHCEWEVGDSEGMDISDDIEIEEAGPADSPDVWLRWGRDGLEEYDPEEESEVVPTRTS
jgi:hypothetical protein